MGAPAPGPARGAPADGDLAALRRTWDAWGREDPLWAVLSVDDRRGNRWDAEEFLRTGREHVAWMLGWLRELGIEPARGDWLDFGCGVGRLTQALAAHAGTVLGVDIAPSMVERAHALAATLNNVRFEADDSGDLRRHPDGSFDLVCSFLVLQHIPTEIALGYVSEFVRVLRPGGVAVFGAPSEFEDASVERYALPAEACRAEIGLSGAPAAIGAGAGTTVDVTVVNRSGVRWPRASDHEGGLGRIHVGNHWTVRGRRAVGDDGRSPLPADVEPGAAVTVPLRVTAPGRPGVYGLEVDLVQEGVCWFADRGSPVARRHVVVLPVRRRAPGSGAADQGAAPNARDAASPAPPVFAMHPLPEERVRAAVAAAGGRVVAAVDEPGDGWRSLRYAVVRDG